METAAAQGKTIEYPSLSDRMQSTFIDVVLIIVMMFVFSSLLDDEAPNWMRGGLFFGLWAIYEPLATCLGCTLGNYLKGICVRSIKDPGKRIGFPQAFIRYLVKFMLGWISFVTIHSNNERRAIHDFAAGSVMICK